MIMNGYDADFRVLRGKGMQLVKKFYITLAKIYFIK